MVGFTGDEKFIKVLPIHAHEMDRAAFAVVFEETTTAGQKANKLVSAELTGSLRKLAVTYLSIAGNVAIDANIVRRVNEHDVSAFFLHQFLKSTLRCSISTMDVMAS